MHMPSLLVPFSLNVVTYMVIIGGRDRRNAHFSIVRKNRDALIEQSRSVYSNRAVTVFKDAVDIGPAVRRKFCLIFVQHFLFVHVSGLVYSEKTGDSVLKEY